MTLKDKMKRESGADSPFSKKGSAWVAKELARKQKEESVLHSKTHIGGDLALLARNITIDPTKPGMRDGFFVYDYDDKKGKRHLEFVCRRELPQMKASASACLSKTEAVLLIRFLERFVEDRPRTEEL